MTKRKRPKFQVGDILEEFYYGHEDGIPDISYWLVVKIKFHCYRLINGKEQKYYFYTLKDINSDYKWSATRNYIDLTYTFRKVA
jgi:hypothetical protein